MIKAFVVLGAAFVSLHAYAGDAAFDAYMNANAKNKALTGKAHNQEAFAATQPYRSSRQDPQLKEVAKSASFKMGGTNTSGSFSGGSSGGSGAGAFKPTTVTTKPVTINPANTAPTAQASNNQNQPYFGTVGVNPTITNSANTASTSSSTPSSSASTASAFCTPEMYGKSPACPPGGGMAGQPAAYGGTVGAYVNSANQQANQIYGATGGSAAQQAAQQAAQAAQQNIIQNTLQQVRINIPR